MCIMLGLGLSECRGIPVSKQNRGGNVRRGVQSQGQKDRCENTHLCFPDVVDDVTLICVSCLQMRLWP